MLVDTEVTLFEFDDGRVPMKSLVDGIGTNGGFGVKATEGGLVVKTTEMGEDIWDLDILRWDDVAIMNVGRVTIMGVEVSSSDDPGKGGNLLCRSLPGVCRRW